MGRVSPLWGYVGAGALAIGALSTFAIVPFLSRAVPRHPAGLVFMPGIWLAQAIAAIAKADPSARVLDTGWRGLIVFVRFDDPTFPEEIARRGAVHSFDAFVAGCHSL